MARCSRYFDVAIAFTTRTGYKVWLATDCSKLLSLIELYGLPVDVLTAELSKHIGIKWKSLARELGFNQTDIDDIEYKDPRNLKEQIFQLFLQWKKTNGKFATSGRLVLAAKRAGLENEIETVIKENPQTLSTNKGNLSLSGRVRIVGQS